MLEKLEVLVLVAAMFGVVVFAVAGAAAQAPAAFEVAAVHQNMSGDFNTQIRFEDGGRLVVKNATLRTLIRNAYGVLPFQMAGGPKWQDDAYFDINAKSEGTAVITPETLKAPLQKFLAERFGLRVHWEAREQPVYALIADKGGVKFLATTGGPDHGMNTSKRGGKVVMKGADVPMAELALNLGNQLQRFVVDETGLAGHYDFVAHWDPDPNAESTEPSVFTALKEQLGLRLESRKGPVQVLVIDGAEKPTDN